MSVVRYERGDQSLKTRCVTGCTNKAAMPQSAALASARRFRERGVQMSAYPCRHCGNWHVGGWDKA